jgi:hypothetical protein
MFKWWLETPKWLHYEVAGVFLAAAGVAWVMGYFWPWAIGIGVV